MKIKRKNKKKEKYEIHETGIFMYSESTEKSKQIIDEEIIECIREFMKETKIKFEMMVNKELVFFRFLDSDMLTKPLANDKATKEFLYKYFRIIDFTAHMSYLLDKKQEETEGVQ